MNIRVKRLITLTVTAIAVDMMYSSAYLPYIKASLFAAAYERAGQYRTVSDLENAFNGVFDFYSPIGQQEAERFLGDRILDMIRDTKQSKQASDALADYAEEVFHIDHPTYRGLNFAQNYSILGNIHLENWRHYREPRDSAFAEKYFLEGLKLSPNRPQFLYGLFWLYVESGQKEKAISLGSEITKYWPADLTVTAAVKNL